MDSNFSLPCFISVKHGRKAVCVLNWGQAPFSYEPKSHAIVPHNFQVETKFLDTSFVGSTSVDAEGKIRYQFKTSSVCGDFCNNATAALQSVADRLGEPFLKRFRRGTGGMLHIGVSYPKLQEAIKVVHEGKMHQVLKSSPPTSPVAAPVVAATKPLALAPLQQQQQHRWFVTEAEEEDVVIASRCLLWLKSSSITLPCNKRMRTMSSPLICLQEEDVTSSL